MSKKEIIMPTKDEVIALLKIAENDNTLQLQDVGELLGIQCGNLLVPEIKGTPEWGFKGLVKFFDEHGIANSYSFKEALDKLNAD